MKKEFRYCVKRALNNQMPSLIELLGDTQISWTSINRGLENYMNNLEKQVADSESGGIHIDATFYDVLVGKFSGQESAFGIFDFFDVTCKQLLQRLSASEVSHLHRMIKPVLTNYDYTYLNFIGELAVLNAYKSTQKYLLLNIEERAYEQNNVKADLYLKRVDDGMEFLVEIVNIHLEKKRFNNPSHIKHHITNKLEEKAKKTFFKSPKKNIYLQPVIWTKELDEIKILAKLYKKHKRDNVFIPMTYLTFKPGDKYEHRFEYVNTILKEDNSDSAFSRFTTSLKAVYGKIKNSAILLSKRIKAILKSNQS